MIDKKELEKKIKAYQKALDELILEIDDITYEEDENVKSDRKVSLLGFFAGTSVTILNSNKETVDELLEAILEEVDRQ